MTGNFRSFVVQWSAKIAGRWSQLNSLSYEVWLLRYGTRQTKFFLILDNFFSYYPSNNPENKNF